MCAFMDAFTPLIQEFIPALLLCALICLMRWHGQLLTQDRTHSTISLVGIRQIA